MSARGRSFCRAYFDSAGSEWTNVLQGSGTFTEAAKVRCQWRLQRFQSGQGSGSGDWQPGRKQTGRDIPIRTSLFSVSVYGLSCLFRKGRGHRPSLNCEKQTALNVFRYNLVFIYQDQDVVAFRFCRN